MAQLALGLAGAAVGSLFGAPGIGFAIGSALGGSLFAPDVEGPRLSDLKGPQGAYGAVIPYVEGHPRLPGVIIWNSDKREIANSQSAGKGGPEQTTFTYVIDVMYALAENDIGELRRVWANGKLVWTNADTSDEDSIAASEEAPWSRITLYRGDADQLPDPTYEAAVGAGNAPAYRDRTTVVIENLDLGGSGQLPVLTFECGGTGAEIPPPALGLLYAPLGNDIEDTIPIVEPATTALPDLAGITFDTEWMTIRKGTLDPGGAGQTVRHRPEKLVPYFKDYSSSQYTSLTIRQIKRNTGSTLGPDDSQRFLLMGSRGVNLTALTLAFRAINDEGINKPQLLFLTQSGGVSLTIESTILAFDSNEEWTFTVYVDKDLPFPGVSDARIGRVYMTSNVEGSSFVTGLPLLEFGCYNYDDISIASNLVSEASTRNGIIGFDAKDLTVSRGQFSISETGTPLFEPTLQAVVERQCYRAGIPTEYVDASDLATRLVSGMALTQIVSPRTVIDTLQRSYFFTAVESGALRFTFRGGDVVETIPYEALGAALDTASNDPLPITLSNDTEQPVQVFVKYSNGDDDYQDGSEQSFRVTNSPGNTAAVELPLVFTPTEAKRIADVTVLLNKAESMKFGPFALSRDYAALEPTDVVILTDRDGNTYRARLTTQNSAQGVLTFEAVLDDATILDSNAETAGGYNNVTTVAPKIPTEFEPLDIPLLRDADDGTGVYWAAGGAAGWPGATWNQSADDATFSRVSQTERNAVIGVTDGTLGNFTGGRFFDEVNVLRVNLSYGQLASYSRDDVLNNGAGAYLVGNEVIQARNATLVSDGVYDLTGLLRGCRGTEWAISGHAANERVVVLTEPTLNRQPLNVSDIGSTIFWKAVTFGRLSTTAASESLVFGSVSQRPFSPVDLRGERDTGDLTMTWRRRTRLSTNFHAHLYPLGEASEAYQVVVYADNTYAVVKRVISTTSQTAAYSSADQTTDFGSPQATVYVDIFQISATAGRGYALRGAI